MDTRWQNTFSSLAGPGIYQAGLALLNAGAVLEWSHEARAIDALVANEQRRFERVRLLLGHRHVACTCSCHTGRRLCAHGVAALLTVARDEPDWLARTATELLPARSAPVKAPAAAPPAPATPPESATPKARARCLRELLNLRPDKPHLCLRFPPDMPSLENRWSRQVVAAWLEAGGRRYSAQNISRLADGVAGSGGMQWDDFLPQEQQLMRFLAAKGEWVEDGFDLGAFDIADLFHLLRGFALVDAGPGGVTIHSDPVEVRLLHRQLAGDACEIEPRFWVAGHGILDPHRLRVVCGTAGYWLGVDGHFWWLPGTMEVAWFRTFLRGATERLTAPERERLLALLQQTGLPYAMVTASEATAGVVAEPGLCRPVLLLDWAGHEIRAELLFDYAGQRVDSRSAADIWTGERFLCRDRERELAAAQWLTGHGFTASPLREHWHLALPDAILRFWDDALEHCPADWHLFFSRTFDQARRSRRAAMLEVAAAGEGIDWFALDCRLRTDDGREIPWDLVQRAVEQGRDGVLLPDGTVVRIPEEVSRAISQLGGDAGTRSEHRFRFPMHHALVLESVLGEWAAGLEGRWRTVATQLAQPPPPDPDMFTPELGSILREYQKDGVAWLRVLHDCGLHGILADEMGLGKTVQALALLAWRKRNGLAHGPSLVICPTSLVENWRHEAERFTPELKTLVIQGAQRAAVFDDLATTDLAVTSYALLRRDVRIYHRQPLDYVLLDEAQHIKNPDTANAVFCKELQATHRLILTGTPVENSPLDLWSLFDFLLPGLLGARDAFQRRYKVGSGGEGGAFETLAARIRPFILRRRKSEVCRQLPPKMEQVLYCEMDAAQERLYAAFLGAGREMVRKAQVEGWQSRRFQVLALLMRLRQVCGHPLLLPTELLPADRSGLDSAKTELLQEMIWESIDSGHRILLFSQFTAFFRLFRPWLDKEGIPYEYLDGNTPASDRLARVNRFNGDAGIPLFLMSLRAGGTGLNLTGADTVIHYDQWWNPMVEDQATDRTHRIGQTRQVTAVKLVVRHSVEEKILVLQEKKRLMFQSLVGGAPARLGELTESDLAFIFDAP